jgi:hypothetical protein
VDLDAGWLIASLVVSSVGFVLTYYGRKMRRAPQLATGVLLMAYPYFVSNLILMFVIAALLLGAMWFALRMGY